MESCWSSGVRDCHEFECEIACVNSEKLVGHGGFPVV